MRYRLAEASQPHAKRERKPVIRRRDLDPKLRGKEGAKLARGSGRPGNSDRERGPDKARA